MFIKNLSVVPAATFAFTPQDPQEKLQNLVDLLENNQPIYVNADGTLTDTNHLSGTGVSQRPTSILSEPQNISKNPGGESKKLDGSLDNCQHASKDLDDEFQKLIDELRDMEPANFSVRSNLVHIDPPAKINMDELTGLPQNPQSRLGGLQDMPKDYEYTLQDLIDLLMMGTEDLSDHSNRVQTDPPVKINMDQNTGLTQNPQSSLGELQNVLEISTDTKRFAATLWYESDSNLVYRGTDLHLTGKQLWENEKQVMSIKFPQAQAGILQSTGEAYWIVPVKLNVGSTTKCWTFMVKYDNNHPHTNDWGGSVKAIPMSPYIDELETRSRAAGRINSGRACKGNLPHIWRDYKDGLLYLNTASKHTQDELLNKHTIQSAAAVMGRAIRWAYYYEVGLLDSRVWDEFCGFHPGSERCFSPSDADCLLELDRWLEANKKR